MLRIAIILGSTRPNRKGEAVAQWVLHYAQGHTDANFDLIDLKEVDLPFPDEAIAPSQDRFLHERIKAWADVVEQYDGYVLVSPEYNHGTSATLKNALDSVYAEWNNKAAGLVLYGSRKESRAGDQLRQILAGMQVTTVEAQVGFVFDRDAWDHTRLRTEVVHEQELSTMLDQLVTWAGALRRMRQPEWAGTSIASIEHQPHAARHGIPGFHPSREERTGQKLAAMEIDADTPGRVNTGTGDQPGNTGGDRFATPNEPHEQEGHSKRAS